MIAADECRLRLHCRFRRPALLAASGLPARWRGRERFVVLEAGFGSPANFLALWQAWRDDPEACRQLHLHRDRAGAPGACGTRAPQDPALPDLARQLAAAWPPPTPNLHRLSFEARPRYSCCWRSAPWPSACPRSSQRSMRSCSNGDAIGEYAAAKQAIIWPGPAAASPRPARRCTPAPPSRRGAARCNRPASPSMRTGRHRGRRRPPDRASSPRRRGSIDVMTSRWHGSTTDAAPALTSAASRRHSCHARRRAYRAHPGRTGTR